MGLGAVLALFALCNVYQLPRSIQFHNFVVKLIKRLKKYQSRGIEVLDAPAIPEDKKFRTYDLIH